MTLLLNMQNIHKHYQGQGVETHALQGIDLQIYQGEFVSISGPSGCGKSTLLAIMGLMDRADSGEYQLANKTLAGLSTNQRTAIRNKHIGFVFQSFNLIDGLSVWNNVALPLEYRGESAAAITDLVEKSLVKVGMQAYGHHKPNQLSGGQQQRVAIARALAGNPELILVDEPTGNLDSQNGDQVMALLQQLNKQGSTIVMVTHDNRYALCASRQIHMLDGKIITEQQMQGAA